MFVFSPVALDNDVDSGEDIDIDAHCMPSHYSTHATVVEELRVEVHSTSRLNEIYQNQGFEDFWNCHAWSIR